MWQPGLRVWRGSGLGAISGKAAEEVRQVKVMRHKGLERWERMGLKSA